jgi:hypothetical protein
MKFDNRKTAQHPSGSKTEPLAVEYLLNFHVFKILPATTLRTIDLGDKKDSGSLFSRFCSDRGVFLIGTNCKLRPNVGNGARG